MKSPNSRCCTKVWSVPDIWAAAWQNQQMTCAPSEDSDQKKHWALNYLLSTQWRFWSDWGNAQADLRLRLAHVILLVLSCGGSFFTEIHVCNAILQCRPWSDRQPDAGLAIQSSIFKLVLITEREKKLERAITPINDHNWIKTLPTSLNCFCPSLV